LKPMERLKETEQEKGKKGISKNASLTKMKSINEGVEEEECCEMEPSGTVETTLLSNQDSREGAQGEIFFPPGLQVSKWVLKSPARMTGEEASGRLSKRCERLPWWHWTWW
jgi:hypothetical protein